MKKVNVEMGLEATDLMRAKVSDVMKTLLSKVSKGDTASSQDSAEVMAAIEFALLEQLVRTLVLDASILAKGYTTELTPANYLSMLQGAIVAQLCEMTSAYIIGGAEWPKITAIPNYN